MRNLLLLGTVLLAAGCTQQPQGPTQVSWAYGAGNGDGVAYPGPAPVYQRAYGAGNGDTVTSGQTATTQYSYGAEGQTGSMVQFAPPTPPTRTASPASGSGAPALQPAPGTHS